MEQLSASVSAVQAQGAGVVTEDFTVLCDHILGSFDHLGSFMYFAKMEMTAKNESLKRVAGELRTLPDVVEADRLSGKAMVKNSCARNLHRLMLVVSFVRQMLQQLLDNPRMQLKDAFYKAYMGSLASIHTYVLQTAVWAALGLLPSREAFLKSIGETEQSARAAAAAGSIIDGATEVVAQLEKLFADVGQMPASDVTFFPAKPAGAS